MLQTIFRNTKTIILHFHVEIGCVRIQGNVDPAIIVIVFDCISYQVGNTHRKFGLIHFSNDRPIAFKDQFNIFLSSKRAKKSQLRLDQVVDIDL